MNASQFKKDMFLKLLPANQFNISQTCKDVDIERNTFYYWKDTDSMFETKLQYLKESRLDRAEQNITDAIEKGNLKASMFLLTTLGKQRGYTTKSLTEISTKKDIVFSFNQDKKKISPPDDDVKLIGNNNDNELLGNKELNNELLENHINTDTQLKNISPQEKIINVDYEVISNKSEHSSEEAAEETEK